jgi:hypothetical protein
MTQRLAAQGDRPTTVGPAAEIPPRPTALTVEAAAVIKHFLDMILSGRGWRCIAVKRGSSWITYFFRTNAEAATFAAEADLDPRAEVFFACATYNEPTRRLKSNVAWAASHWLDIDCGPGKGYSDITAGLAALLAFCQDLGLPLPVVVASGRGCHCYWVFDADQSPGEWEVTAALLKAATERQGLAADASRTTDIASLLRPVGVHHKKDAPVLVKLLRGVL